MKNMTTSRRMFICYMEKKTQKWTITLNYKNTYEKGEERVFSYKIFTNLW